MKAKWLMIALMCSSMSFAGSAAEKTLQGMTAEKPGSPYHWITMNMGGGAKTLERELMGKPAATVADETLKADILKTITQLEESFGGSQIPKVVEIRFVSKKNKEYNEIWVILREKERVPYTVFIKKNPKEGTDFKVQGPWD